MPVPFSQLQLNFIEATIEENQWFDGLKTVQSYLSPRHYPPAELLHHIMQQMLKVLSSYHLNKKTTISILLSVHVLSELMEF